jgi:hypothetical protein
MLEYVVQAIFAVAGAYWISPKQFGYNRHARKAEFIYILEHPMNKGVVTLRMIEICN